MAFVQWLGRESPIMGQIDHISHRIVRGWAWLPKDPHRRVRLEVFDRDIYLGRVSSGMFRADLQAQGIGDGHHAFTFHLPDDVPVIGFNPARISVISAGPQRWPLPLSSEIVSSGSRARRLSDDYRLCLGPFLEMLRDNDSLRKRPGTQIERRPRVDCLLENVVNFDVSAFVAHIALKYARSELASGDVEGLWRWYFSFYARERGPQLAPLSRTDIEHLTGTKDSSYASRLLLTPHPSHATYEWSLEADRLFVADCLVRTEEVCALRDVGPKRTAYPLSVFMRLMKSETAMLRSRPIATQGQRKHLYALFMIIGLRNPSILTYLPTEWMLKLLESPYGLQTAVSHLFKADLAFDRDRYTTWVEASGYDLASQLFCGHFYRRHRVLGGSVVVDGPVSVDVQIFGPFRRKTGLGESCRRVAAALRTTSFSINLVDYDVGIAGTYVEANDSLEAPRRARLNILHLNAEEIPEALAYLPDVFSQSPMVALPYWELNLLSRVHCLGVQVVDEIWVASRYLEKVFIEGGKPVRWIGMCCAQDPAPTADERVALRSQLGLGAETFVFLTTSDALSWVQRKNPLAVIDAFRAAFATGDVALVVKTHNLAGPLTHAQTELWDQIRALCAADPRLILVDQSFDAKTQRTLVAASNCFVSLHRAEGLGLEVIDALDIGTPVIATDYSGTKDLANTETAWMVDFDLRPLLASDYNFVEPGHFWAEPRQSSAVEAMRAVVASTGNREARVRCGQALVAATASLRSFAERLEQAVGTLLN